MISTAHLNLTSSRSDMREALTSYIAPVDRTAIFLFAKGKFAVKVARERFTLPL